MFAADRVATQVDNCGKQRTIFQLFLLQVSHGKRPFPQYVASDFRASRTCLPCLPWSTLLHRDNWAKVKNFGRMCETQTFFWVKGRWFHQVTAVWFSSLLWMLIAFNVSYFAMFQNTAPFCYWASALCTSVSGAFSQDNRQVIAEELVKAGESLMVRVQTFILNMFPNFLLLRMIHYCYLFQACDRRHFQQCLKHFLDPVWFEATTCSAQATKFIMYEVMAHPNSMLLGLGAWRWGCILQHGPSTWFGNVCSHVCFFPMVQQATTFFLVFVQLDFNGHASGNVWWIFRIQYPDWLLREEDHPLCQRCDGWVDALSQSAGPFEALGEEASSWWGWN